MTRKPSEKAFLPCDEEERILMEMHERGDYAPVAGKRLAYLKKYFQVAAQNSQKTRERQHISIKVAKEDLALLKNEAEQKGLGYQTLINSVLHQYVTGRLKYRK
jgi:uncharacterized protein (DUF4415 family)